MRKTKQTRYKLTSISIDQEVSQYSQNLRLNLFIYLFIFQMGENDAYMKD